MTYALQDADKHDDVAGEGHGFVNAFDTAGNLKVRILTSKIPADFGIEGMKFTQQHQSFSLETKKT